MIKKEYKKRLGELLGETANILLVGMSIAYILLYIVGMDVEVAGILAGIVTAILIVAIDFKKTNINDKMTECTTRIIRKILKIRYIDKK